MRVTVIFGSLAIVVLSCSGAFCGEVTDCPLWHIKQEGKCECNTDFGVVCECKKDNLLVRDIFCLTWDNDRKSARASFCLFTPGGTGSCSCGEKYYYSIPTNLSGNQLNKWMCGKYNWQGTQCKECISGYGPSVFSDGISCANCSWHRYTWILNLLFQLLCITIMFVAIMLLKMKGSSCPWNIIITYSQLTVNAISYDFDLHHQTVCFVGSKMSIAILTILGITNLDLFHMVIPPLCPTMKAIDILFFDYIIALYPILLTVVVYFWIELHDRGCQVVVILSIPLCRLNRIFRGNPKQMIVSTFVTFLLLSYSKLLFVSCKFLFAVQSYNNSGDLIPNSTVLKLITSPTLSLSYLS